MKKVLLLLTVILLTISCGKDKPQPIKPQELKFETSYEKFTPYDNYNANYIPTLWKFTYKDDVNKVVGSTKHENRDGKKFNVVENTVGRSPIYVYFVFETVFEAKDKHVAEKYRLATVNWDLKRGLYALIRNVGRPEFKQDDLSRLNRDIVNFLEKELNSLMKKEIEKGEFKITSFTKDPLKIVQ